MYKYKHYILYINKARRGVFYGYIKDQDFRKNNITYESKQVESVEEKLIIINEFIKQILSEVEEPLFIIKDEKDYLLIKMCLMVNCLKQWLEDIFFRVQILLKWYKR